jgi:hypothetical protein
MADDNLPDVTPDEMQQELLKSYADALREAGVDEEYIARKHKAELNARRKSTVKLKGKLPEGEELPSGYKTIATTLPDDEGKRETLVEVSGPDMQIRQRGREGANRMLDHIPSDRLLIEKTGTVIIKSYVPEPDALPDFSDGETHRISGTDDMV